MSFLPFAVVVIVVCAVVAAAGLVFIRLTRPEDTDTHCVGAVRAHAPRHAATLPRLTAPGKQPWITTQLTRLEDAPHG